MTSPEALRSTASECRDCAEGGVSDCYDVFAEAADALDAAAAEIERLRTELAALKAQ